MSSVREGPSDELLAGWSTELEAVLYSPEVEEAINEVPTYLVMRLHYKFIARWLGVATLYCRHVCDCNQSY